MLTVSSNFILTFYLFIFTIPLHKTDYFMYETTKLHLNFYYFIPATLITFAKNSLLSSNFMTFWNVPVSRSSKLFTGNAFTITVQMTIYLDWIYISSLQKSLLEGFSWNWIGSWIFYLDFLWRDWRSFKRHVDAIF